jgi:hypothetical protein
VIELSANSFSPTAPAPISASGFITNTEDIAAIERTIASTAAPKVIIFLHFLPHPLFLYYVNVSYVKWFMIYNYSVRKTKSIDNFEMKSV